MLRKISLTATVFSLLTLFGCQSKNDSKTVSIGVISGPESELVSTAAEVMQQQHQLTLKVVEFTDYSMPNRALADKSIDANMFQHQPYLDADDKAHNYHLVALGRTFIYPMGIYSQRLKSLSNLRDHAIIAVPNDPSNEARALLLLQKNGLIQLKAGVTTLATIQDIDKNTREYQFKELDAAQLPRVLPDVDLAVINTNYALPAGLKPKQDALAIEGTDSLYANLLVVREAEKARPEFQQLLAALHSPQVQAKAKELFQDQAIAAWENASK
jgi:D-methionine transport system substrate-binding protein